MQPIEKPNKYEFHRTVREMNRFIIKYPIKPECVFLGLSTRFQCHGIEIYNQFLEPLGRYIGHNTEITALYALTSDIFLSCSKDRSIKLWSLSGKCCYETILKGSNRPITAITKISQDCFAAATTSNITIYDWNQRSKIFKYDYNADIYANINFLMYYELYDRFILGDQQKAINIFDIARNLDEKIVDMKAICINFHNTSGNIAALKCIRVPKFKEGDPSKYLVNTRYGVEVWKFEGTEISSEVLHLDVIYCMCFNTTQPAVLGKELTLIAGCNSGVIKIYKYYPFDTQQLKKIHYLNITQMESISSYREGAVAFIANNWQEMSANLIELTQFKIKAMREMYPPGCMLKFK